jgi:hypothetical protein
MKIIALFATLLLTVAVRSEVVPGTTKQLRNSEKAQERRVLQPEPPSPPSPPAPPAPSASTSSTQPTQPTASTSAPDDTEETDPLDYCSFAFHFFDAQASARGYDCTCNSEGDFIVEECEKEEEDCYAYNVGGVDSICHIHHYTATTSKTALSEEGYVTYEVESCNEYDTDRAPDFFQDRNLCFVYQLKWTNSNWLWPELETCEVTLDQVPDGEPQKICDCAVCQIPNALGIPMWGLGFDCQEALLGFKLYDCIPLATGSLAVVPEIEEIRVATTEDETTQPPATTPEPTEPNDATDPPTITDPAETTESPTMDLLPLEVPETPTTGDSNCNLQFYLEDGQELECTCNITDHLTVACVAKEPECNALYAYGTGILCHDTSFSVSVKQDWLAGITTFDFDVCVTYAYPDFAPDFLEGREFCFGYDVTWDWVSLDVEQCSAEIFDPAGKAEECNCTICQTPNNETGYSLVCPNTTEIAFLECQPILNPNEVSLPTMEFPTLGMSKFSYVATIEILDYIDSQKKPMINFASLFLSECFPFHRFPFRY